MIFDEAAEAEAWRLLLSYAESGLEDDLNEDGLDEEFYGKIIEYAWVILRGLRAAHPRATHSVDVGTDAE